MQIWEGEWDIGAALIHGSASGVSAALADLGPSVALAGTVILSSEASVDSAGLSSGVLADSGFLSSEGLEGSAGHSTAATGSARLSSGALVVTGRLSLVDTAATVDSVTHGIRK